jgi:hypothetical protein
VSDDNPHKFFTAGEAAAFAKAHSINGVPLTESGMIKWIKRHDPECIGWMSRTRKGQKGGGGKEYNWSFFPESLWPMLTAEIERRNALVPYVPPAPSISKRERYKQARSQSIDLSAPNGVWADSLAAAVGLGSAFITFQPFLIGKVSRYLVRVDNKKYFSRDLSELHGEMVCVTRAQEAPDLLWVMEYEKPRYSRPCVGRLICVADARLGKTRYVSVEFQEMAEAKRAAAFKRRRLLRLE